MSLHPISRLKLKEASRAPGWLDEIMRVGKIIGSGNATLVELTPEQFATIRKQFNPRFPHPALRPPSPSGRGQGEGSPGLGDKVHSVLGPIGKAIHWPCLKGDGTTDLKPGSPCDKIKNTLNKI